MTGDEHISAVRKAVKNSFPDMAAQAREDAQAYFSSASAYKSECPSCGAPDQPPACSYCKSTHISKGWLSGLTGGGGAGGVGQMHTNAHYNMSVNQQWNQPGEFNAALWLALF